MRKSQILIYVLSGLLLLGSLQAATAAEQRDVTIEKLLSTPFPSGLVASGSAGKLAWVQNAEGVRNIWVASAPAFEGRSVTNYAKDDGQEITRLSFTPDARFVVYVRGGAPNRAGVIPNPTSEPAGQEQAVWYVSSEGGEPNRIDLGHSPAVSPKSNVVTYINRGQIFCATIGEAGEPKPLLKPEGGPSSLRWSPDGSKLAFSSNRGDHSFIGVFDLSARTVRYLDPGVDEDSAPAWSPDGSHLAFLRVATEQPTLFISRRKGQPWSIVVAEATTGRCKVIWRADEGTGSVFSAVTAENQIFWGTGDRLVFPWERDGWLHLYSISIQGGTPALLTPGGFEVEDVTLGRDRREVIFNSNQDDIDRRHLWRVPVSGGQPSVITPGKGIEWSPVVTSDGGSMAFIGSGAKTPARVMIMAGSGQPKELAPGSMSREFPENSLVEPQQVIISAADGMKIHGQLFLPADLRTGERRPALLFFHGGPRRQMLLGFHYMDYYHNTYAMNQYLVSRGFIVLSVNYRCGIGYGMEFREPIKGGAGGASELHDLFGAGLYLRNRGDVDPARIGLWGGSYGGYMTAQGLARASDLFAAGVDVHGAHNWNVVINNFIPSYNVLEHPEDAKLAWESSPISGVSTWRSPVLFISGDDDRNAPFSETVTLIRALRKYHVEIEQLVLPDEVHDMLLHSNVLKTYRAASEFLERKVKNKKAEARH